MSSLPLRFSLAFYAGDDNPLKIRWKNNDGSTIDLTGYAAKTQFKTENCGIVALEILGVIAAPTTGEIVFPFSGLEKQALIVDCQSTCYKYDIELTQPSTDIITILYGSLRINEDVTR